jgi:hypothetical protein
VAKLSSPTDDNQALALGRLAEVRETLLPMLLCFNSFKSADALRRAWKKFAREIKAFAKQPTPAYDERVGDDAVANVSGNGDRTAAQGGRWQLAGQQRFRFVPLTWAAGQGTAASAWPQ